MNDSISLFLARTGPTFCLDIGSGTQDGLLAIPDLPYDNWPRFVLPSPAQSLGKAIRSATAQGRSIWLYGDNMGGGFSPLVKAHRAAGLSVYASASAAKAIHDNPEVVSSMGVEFSECCPDGALPLHLTDYSREFWQGLFRQLDLPIPALTVVAAQDHGFCPEGNRVFRMKTWTDLLTKSDDPSDWIYTSVPASLTRLATIAHASGGPVADTGASALLAFLCDSAILGRSFQEGITLVNAGNTHVLAALVFRGRVVGLYEQHTELLDQEQLSRDLKEFRLGWLPAEVVQKAGGHGTVYARREQEAGGFEPTFFTGPARQRFAGLGRMVHPAGDMMVAGCFGLLLGLSSRSRLC